MEQSVTIKGTKSGIILVLDPSMPFEELAVHIAEKFHDARSFLGKNEVGLLVRGRALSEEEMDTVVNIIQANSRLLISCILDEEPLKSEPAPASLPAEEDFFEDEESDIYPGENAFIYKGNLKSGQDISIKKSIVILGDVKPGANVTSTGSIFVMGELRGNANAGSEGDEKAINMALELDPIQLRIADTVGVSPDAEKGERIRVKKKKFLAPRDDKGAEVAYIENGHIVKAAFGASFLRNYFVL